MKEYNAKRWDNATKAFERLTTELSPRDPRISTAYYYLAKSQEKKGDDLLAAKSYSRFTSCCRRTAWPTISSMRLALRISTCGKTRARRGVRSGCADAVSDAAVAVPDSPSLPRADTAAGEARRMVRNKDYSTGYHYLKRKAYDSAIIYFKDVIKLHPNANKTREAYLRLHEAYKAINYKEDMRDTCDAARKAYPNDREVRDVCGPARPRRRRSSPCDRRFRRVVQPTARRALSHRLRCFRSARAR